ncbi:MAG: phosphatase PAP2 family protein [Leptolyngbya sp. SIO4C1]|nr:phosphatase PAP2 family protein [Leptolyngbya sp. SIO4C1]
MDTITTLQAFFGPSWQTFFLGVSALGSKYAYITLIALYYWLVSPQLGRQLGMTLGLSYVSNLLLKDLFNQPRPFTLNPDVAMPLAQATADGNALPSGHSQGAATFWFFLAWRYARLWPLATVFVALVALSRLYLGVHYPLDVIAGVLIGLAFAWVGSRQLRSLTWPRQLEIATVLAAFLAAVALPEIAAPLGVFIGFWLASVRFKPPLGWPSKIFWSVSGLSVVLLSLIGLGELSDWASLPEWMDYWRYLAVTLLATEGWPRLMQFAKA